MCSSDLEMLRKNGFFCQLWATYIMPKMFLQNISVELYNPTFYSSTPLNLSDMENKAGISSDFVQFRANFFKWPLS